MIPEQQIALLAGTEEIIPRRISRRGSRDVRARNIRKSLGDYIGVADAADDMFGKVMSL